MSSFKKGSLVVLALASALASNAVAQARTPARPATQQRQAAASDKGFWELGTDFGITLGIDDPKTFNIDIPSGLLRAGYFITPEISLEPALSFNSQAQEDETAFSFWLLQLGGLYHLSTNRRADQWFIHPSIGFTGGSEGTPDFVILSATVGLKKPWMNNRLAMRFEAGLSHRLENAPFDAATAIIASAGFSVYTR
jgi:hypothetical protein